jgi:hypothetical protein
MGVPAPPRRVTGLLYWLLAVNSFATSGVFTNAPWSDPRFFPLGVWLQVPEHAARYRAAGINTYVGLWHGPKPGQLETLRAAGMYVICAPNEVARAWCDPSPIIAWQQLPDEPDNAKAWGARLGLSRPIPPAVIVAQYEQMRAWAATRPVFLGLGQGVAWDGWLGRGTRNRHPEDYREYQRGADLLGFNFYPVNHEAGEINGHLWYVAEGVKRLRAWSDALKPVWACIETTQIDLAGRAPTPAEVRAQVWLAVIHGARGIVYFVHRFRPQFVEAGLLADAEMLAAVTAINQELTTLAPVLNAPNSAVTVVGQSQNPAAPVAVMARDFGGDTYVFAAALRPVATEVEFMLPFAGPEAGIEVLGEGRSVTLAARRFRDQFAPYAVHLYRVRKLGGPP